MAAPGDDEYVALEAMIRILLDGRPKGFTVGDLPALHDRFGHLPPFEKYVWPGRVSARTLKQHLLRSFAEWLPSKAGDLKRLGLTSDPGGRHLVSRLAAGDKSIEQLPMDWDLIHRRDWTHDQRSAYIAELSQGVAIQLMSTAEPSSAPEASPVTTPASPTPVQPTWRHSVFDGIRERPDSLATMHRWLERGSAPLLVVEGSPGTGKSSLLVSFLRSLDEMPEVTIACAMVRDTRRADPFDAAALLRGVIAVDLDQVADPALADFLATSDLTLDPSRLLPLAERIIDARPADRPVVVVVDAVDQIEDANRHDLIEVLDRLVRQAPGTGFRFVMSSRRALPAGLPSTLGVGLKLQEDSDPGVLAAELDHLLADLDAEDRPKVHGALLRGSAGSWLWACINARALVNESADGRVTWPLNLGEGIQSLWYDGMAGLSRRHGEATYDEVVRPLLGCLAVSTEGRLGLEELRWVLGVPADRLAQIARQAEPFVVFDQHARVLRLCHPDLGRWILHDSRWGMPEADAHLRLASGLLRFGERTGWAPITAGYAAPHVIEHFVAGISLDPFRPDRGEYVDQVGRLMGDTRRLSRVEDGFALVQAVATVALVTPEVAAPHGGDLTRVLASLQASPEIRPVLGNVLMLTDSVSTEVLARIGEMAMDLRHWESMEHLADWVRSEIPSAGRGFVFLWAAYLTGLITVSESESDVLSATIDLGFVDRHLGAEPAPDPLTRSVVGGVLASYAEHHPDRVLRWLEVVVAHPELISLSADTTADLLATVSESELSTEQAEALVELADRLPLLHPLGDEARDKLLDVVANAAHDVPLPTPHLAERWRTAAERIVERSPRDDPPQPFGQRFEERSLLRARTAVQRSVPASERDLEECAAIVTDIERALDHPEVRSAYGQYLRWDLIRALELRYDPHRVPDRDVLDRLLEVEEQWLDRVGAGRDQITDTLAVHAFHRYHRWTSSAPRERDPADLRAGLAAAREALALEGEAARRATLTPLVLLLEARLEASPSAGLARELLAARKRLLGLLPEGSPEHAAELLAVDVARKRLTDLDLPTSQAGPSLDELRARLAQAAPEERDRARVDLLNAMPVHGVPGELLEERIQLLEQIVLEREELAPAASPDHPATRLAAIRLALAQAYRAAGLVDACLAQLELAACAGETRHRVRAIGDMGKVLRNLNDDPIAVPWTGTLMRRAEEVADAARQESDQPGAALATGVALDAQVYLLNHREPGAEVDWDEVFARARARDDATAAISAGALDDARATGLWLYVQFVASYLRGHEGAPAEDPHVQDFLTRFRTTMAATTGSLPRRPELFNQVFKLVDKATSAPNEDARDAKGRELAGIARARLASVPDEQRADTLWQLCEGLNLVARPTVEELVEIISRSREHLSTADVGSSNWRRRAEVAGWHLRELEVRTVQTTGEYGSEERKLAIELARGLMDSYEPESDGWFQAARRLYRALDHPDQTSAELDEEISLRERLLPWASAQEGSCAGCVWSGLGVSLYYRARRTQVPHQRASYVERAAQALARAVELEPAGIDRLRAGCHFAVATVNLATAGVIPVTVALDRAVTMMGRALLDLPEDTPLTALGQLPLTVVQAMNAAGVWPAAPELPRVQEHLDASGPA